MKQFVETGKGVGGRQNAADSGNAGAMAGVGMGMGIAG